VAEGKAWSRGFAAQAILTHAWPSNFVEMGDAAASGFSPEEPMWAARRPDASAALYIKGESVHVRGEGSERDTNRTQERDKYG
jgi:hypothetical protein